MSKFTPSLTGNKEYSLSLVAINQHGTRCDIIWSYIDDDGDEMFVREFRDNFRRHVRKTAVSPKYHYKQYVEREYAVRGCYATFNHIAGLCIRATLGMAYNPSTGRDYTIITKYVREADEEFRMCSKVPYFWLTDEGFFGFQNLQALDHQFAADVANANNMVDEEVMVINSGEYDEAMHAVSGEVAE